MRPTTGLLWVSVLFIAGCSTTPGSAQTAPPEPVAEVAATTTIWDGVYTADQAERGEGVAQASCFGCHSANDWASPMFLTVWSGRPIGVLYENLRMTMPYDAPGRLSREEYADLVAYMLELNDVPTGESELPSDEQGLSSIMVAPATND